ncbi:ribonuclease H1 small subunit [Rickenella mellea]|uniref:Ribonuclease H1 small subunit n=1 Tax=Rickenella mellea TaxID=50990 RepID=A0A4Y7QH60_9AGAM|nr:ribonuclease H1 small subunit [Rickenella mellea]
MASQALEISPASKTLPETTPNLMPFHINFSGLAPISTFFRVKDAPEETGHCGAAPESAIGLIEKQKKRFLAAFRGRTVHGLEVCVPEGYQGVVLRVEGERNDSQTREVEEKLEKKGKGKGKQTRRPTRASRRAQAVEEEECEREPAPSSQMEVVDDDETLLSLQANPEDENVRRLKPSATFSSFVLWNPDGPVDEGKDEYLRSLNEWMSISAEVHRVEED